MSLGNTFMGNFPNILSFIFSATSMKQLLILADILEWNNHWAVIDNPRNVIRNKSRPVSCNYDFIMIKLRLWWFMIVVTSLRPTSAELTAFLQTFPQRSPNEHRMSQGGYNSHRSSVALWSLYFLSFLPPPFSGTSHNNQIVQHQSVQIIVQKLQLSKLTMIQCRNICLDVETMKPSSHHCGMIGGVDR